MTDKVVLGAPGASMASKAFTSIIERDMKARMGASEDDLNVLLSDVDPDDEDAATVAMVRFVIDSALTQMGGALLSAAGKGGEFEKVLAKSARVAVTYVTEESPSLQAKMAFENTPLPAQRLFATKEGMGLLVQKRTKTQLWVFPDGSVAISGKKEAGNNISEALHEKAKGLSDYEGSRMNELTKAVTTPLDELAEKITLDFPTVSKEEVREITNAAIFGLIGSVAKLSGNLSGAVEEDVLLKGLASYVEKSAADGSEAWRDGFSVSVGGVSCKTPDDFKRMVIDVAFGKKASLSDVLKSLEDGSAGSTGPAGVEGSAGRAGKKPKPAKSLRPKP